MVAAQLFLAKPTGEAKQGDRGEGRADDGREPGTDITQGVELDDGVDGDHQHADEQHAPELPGRKEHGLTANGADAEQNGAGDRPTQAGKDAGGHSGGAGFHADPGGPPHDAEEAEHQQLLGGGLGRHESPFRSRAAGISGERGLRVPSVRMAAVSRARRR